MSRLLNTKGVTLCFGAFLVLHLYLSHSIQQWLFEQLMASITLSTLFATSNLNKIKMYPKSIVWCGTTSPELSLAVMKTVNPNRMFSLCNLSTLNLETTSWPNINCFVRQHYGNKEVQWPDIPCQFTLEAAQTKLVLCKSNLSSYRLIRWGTAHVWAATQIQRSAHN